MEQRLCAHPTQSLAIAAPIGAQDLASLSAMRPSKIEWEFSMSS
jgi:hypothetical protein